MRQYNERIQSKHYRWLCECSIWDWDKSIKIMNGICSDRFMCIFSLFAMKYWTFLAKSHWRKQTSCCFCYSVLCIVDSRKNTNHSFMIYFAVVFWEISWPYGQTRTKRRTQRRYPMVYAIWCTSAWNRWRFLYVLFHFRSRFYSSCMVLDSLTTTNMNTD